MYLLLVFLLLISPFVFAAEGRLKLPDPLSLEYALQLVDENHPDVSDANQDLQLARSKTMIAESQSGLQLRAQARARLIDPPPTATQYGRQDHEAKILLSKTIYDFGRSHGLIQSAKIQEAIKKLQLKEVKQYRRIEIMQAFFDVVLSDLTYLRDNEAMTVDYLRFDRVRERKELGQFSDVDVLEKENAYLEKRKVRYKSEALQRLLRSQFSLIVNHPGDMVRRFQVPELDYHKFKLIEVIKLQQSAVDNNVLLKSIQLTLDALRAEMKSIRANRYPSISAEIEAGLYERNIGGNDRWQAGLVVDVPLYQGGKVSGLISSLRSQIKKTENKLYLEKLKIKQAVLTHALMIESLTAQKASSDKRYDYRELYLDRARAIYEMEVKTDLGDAMVQLSQATLQAAETDFEIAIHWEQLRMLTQMTFEEMRQ